MKNRPAGRIGSELRVLQMIARLDPEAGGPPASAVATAIAIRQLGVANEFVVPVAEKRERAVASSLETLRSHGIKVHTFRVPRFFGGVGTRWGISIGLLNFVVRRARTFDVIHVHMGWTFPAVIGLAAGRVLGRTTVLSPHESLTDFDRQKSGRYHRALKLALRFLYLHLFDAVVASSELELRQMGRYAKKRAVVVHHAVRAIESVPKYQLRKEWPIGFIGRLDPKKNVEVILEALSMLPPTVTLRIAGDGPPTYRSSLRTLAERLGVHERVEWDGFVTGHAKRKFFDDIDILVMPSAFECFGVAAVEALYAGVPVVVSPDVGVADTVRRYGCGRVTEPTAPAVCDAIRALLDDRRRHEASSQARRAAEDSFGINGHGQQLLALYAQASYLRSLGRRA